MGKILLSSLLRLKGEEGDASAYVLTADGAERIHLGKVERVLLSREAERDFGDFLLGVVLDGGVNIGMEGAVLLVGACSPRLV
jgi:hypothetical protein